MYDKTQHKIKVVTGKDAARFERNYNAIAAELAEYDPDVSVKIEGGMFYAVFTYTLHKPYPETIQDEFTLAGISHKCAECPYLEIGNDNRRKVWPCKYSEYGSANMEKPACEYLLKKLMQGKVKLRDIYGDEEGDNED